MNNKLLLIPIVSLGAIVPLPQSAHADTLMTDPLSSEVPQKLEVSRLDAQETSSLSVGSVSMPEMTQNTPLEVPVSQPQTLVDPKPTSDPISASSVASVSEPVSASIVTSAIVQTELVQVPATSVEIPSEVKSEVRSEVKSEVAVAPTLEPSAPLPLLEKASGPMTEAAIGSTSLPVAQGNTVAIATRSTSATATTQPVQIEVGSSGIPPITDLPSRVALPSAGLLPGNFEYPVNLGQAVDTSVATSSPITDRLADPSLSAHLQNMQTFLATKPEAITVPCDSLPTADCSPMMKPINPEAYKAKGLSLKGSDPVANPDNPAMVGPIVRERLRLTVDEIQAYRSAYSQNLVAWSERVRQCMDEKPRMYVLRSDGAQLPVYFNGQEGTIVLNASGQAVCTN